MFVRLVTDSIYSEDVSYLRRFPTFLLDKEDEKIRNWIVNFFDEYGKVPTFPTVKKQFPWIIALDETDEPLAYVYDSTLDEMKTAWASHELEKLSLEVDIGEVSDVGERISELAHMLTGLSSEVIAYDEYDRDKPLRERVLKTGIKEIDRVTHGLADGDFGIIFGRLGNGKSLLAGLIAVNWYKQGKKVLVVSAEMLADDIYSRMDGTIGAFNPNVLRDPSAVVPQRAVIAHIARNFEGKILTAQRAVATPGAIRDLIRRFNVDAVVIDGLHLMRSDFGGVKAGWERLKDISNAIKLIALQERVPILAITQQKRGERETASPEDIAYSDAIGQDADIVISVKQEVKDEATRSTFLICISKNRFGAEAAAHILFSFNTMSILSEIPVTVEVD